MESFGRLLSTYMERTGVSDAALARAIGVRRQTIFRWKEGLTARPRHRDDVLACARKLRLTPEESDALLLAAGFPPLETPQPMAPDAAAPSSPPGSERQRLGRWRLPLILVGAAAVVLVTAGVWLRATSMRRRLFTVVPAQPGETLVLVSRFANFSQRQGYNVAGRLHEALEKTFQEEQLPDVRVAVRDQPLADDDEAVATAQEYGAALVIWGEYDSGRVLANFTLPAGQEGQPARRVLRQVQSPEDLNAVINTELPTTAQWVAAVSVAQLHYRADRFAAALAAYERALQVPDVEQAAQASVLFAVGFLHGLRGDGEQAVAYYTRALGGNPELVSAYSNRGAAYLWRGDEDSLRRAISDFSQAIELAPNFAAAHFNRGLAYFALGETHDEQSLLDLRRAHSLEPDAPGPNNALCWQLSLLGRPDEALPYCDAAVATDPSGLSRDSRGLTYALLGRPAEAIEEFGAFLDWVDDQPSETSERYQDRRGWVEALAEGLNPFSEETLRALRTE
jgi:tetratricopeptide (TPR) repeat protein